MTEPPAQPPATPAGWYPDPQTPGYQRYWNGIDWTGPSSPLPPIAPQPVYIAVPPALPRFNGQSVAALVLGIVGLVLVFVPFVGLVLGLLAVVFGVVGLRTVRASERGEGELRRGTGLAVAGIVTGGVALLVGGLFWVVFVLGMRVSSSFEQTNACVSNPTSVQCR